MDITGYLLPTFGACGESVEPLFAEFGGSSLYLCVFSSIQHLRAFANAFGVSKYRVKKIDDQWGFLESIPGMLEGRPVKIAVDPTVHENGRLTFVQLLRN